MSQKRRSHEIWTEKSSPGQACTGRHVRKCVYLPRVAPCALSDIISELKMFVDAPENLI